MKRKQLSCNYGALNENIGLKISQRRTMLRMSRKELGDFIGVTGPTVKKYETGELRVSAVRLLKVSEALEVDVQYFYDYMYSSEAQAAATKDHKVELLIQLFKQIRSPVLQNCLYDHIERIVRLYSHNVLGNKSIKSRRSRAW